MQKHKPITLHLPGLLMEQLRLSLQDRPPGWGYQLDYFIGVIHYLVMREVQWKNVEDGYYPVNMKNLRRVTVSNIDRYIKYLVDEELLLRDYYIPGEKPYYYKLNPGLLWGTKTLLLESDSKVFMKMIENWALERHNANRLSPYLQQMRKRYLEVDLDYSMAEEWINIQPEDAKRNYYRASIERFRDMRSRYFSRNKTNDRLDSNLTAIKRELRQCLAGDWVSIDLANSQPFLLSQVLDALFTGILGSNPNPTYTTPISISNSIPLCSYYFELDLVKWFGKQTVNQVAKIPHIDANPPYEELLNLQISCISGSFYEDFMGRFGDGGLNREDVKEMMFPVLFSRNEIHQGYKRRIPYEKEKERFARVYPYVAAVIETLKRKDHTKLSILLQKLESAVFIDTICPRLVGQGIVPLTIHDSFIIEAAQANTALKICEDVFKAGFGVIPTFHVKPLRQKQDISELAHHVDTESDHLDYKLSA